MALSSLEYDFIANQYPGIVNDPEKRRLANSWLSSKTNPNPIGEPIPERVRERLATSSTPTSAPTTKTSSFGSTLKGGSMEGAAIGAAVSGVSSAVGGLFSIGSSLIQASAQRDIAAMQNKLGESQLAQQQKMFDTEWGAARQAGLYSPAQFGSIQGAGYYKASAYGPGLSQRIRAPTGSPYA